MHSMTHFVFISVLSEERGNLWQLNDLTDFGGDVGYE